MHVEPWTFWNETLKAPRYVLGPMVNQSELQFRLLVKRHGCHLCYSPMLHARLFATDEKYRRKFMPDAAIAEDQPLVVQFCANDPDTVVAAAKLVESVAAAVDLNCGCPQGIARRGGYGSFLLSKPDAIVAMAEALVERVKLPVFVKIRLLDETDLTPTLDLAKRLEAAGVAAICLHGRTAAQKGQQTGPPNWLAIKRLVEELKIPVIANGGVGSRAEADKCLEVTGAAAVMSAEGLLEDPSLFADERVDVDTLMNELVSLYEQFPAPDNWPCLKAHLFHALYTGLQTHTDLRDTLAKSRTLDEYKKVVQDMTVRRTQVKSSHKLGWYRRHRKNEALDSELVKEALTDDSTTEAPKSEALSSEVVTEALTDDSATEPSFETVACSSIQPDKADTKIYAIESMEPKFKKRRTSVTN